MSRQGWADAAVRLAQIKAYFLASLPKASE